MTTWIVLVGVLHHWQFHCRLYVMYRSIIFVTAFHFYHRIPVELADETLAGSLSVGLVTATSCASFLRCNIMEDIFPWSSPLFVNWLLSTLSSSPHWRNQNITMLSIWHGHSPFALILLKLNYDWVTVSYGYPISQSDFALQMYIALTLTTQKLERIEHQNRTKPNFGNMIPYLNHGGQATVFCYFC